MLFFIFILFCLMVLAYFGAMIEQRRRKIEKDFRHIPGPKELMGIGNFLAISRNSISEFESLIEKVCPEPVTKLTFAGYLAFSTYDPAIVKQLLLLPGFLEKPYVFDFFELEHGLFSAKYKLWKPVRKVANPMFNHKSVIAMSDKFNKHIDSLCEKLGEHLGQGSFDLLKLCIRFTMEQIFDTMLDTEFHADDSDAIMVQEITEAVSIRAFYLLFHPNFIYRYTSLHTRAKAWHEYLECLLNPIIRKKYGDISQERQINGQNINNNNNKHTFIHELLRMCYFEEMLPHEALMDNLKTVILAGSETTALTITNTILMLAMNPEIDMRVYQEIKEFCQEGIELDFSTLKDMTYLDMVVKETLRLFPAVPGTIRDTLADTFINGIGVIPKGTKILIVAFKMHRDPKIWGPSCNKFDPDNFTAEKEAARHPYCYLPYSSGARNCIGQHYANLNVRMALVKILSKYRFSTELKFEDISFKFCVSLKLNNECLVQIHKRN